MLILAGIDSPFSVIFSVPKKVMWNAAFVAETLKEANEYAFSGSFSPFNWALLKEKRDSYIARLNGIYESNMAKDGIDRISGKLKLYN